MPRRGGLGVAGGVAMGLILWGLDLASLARLRVAGVSDAAAQAGVVAAAWPAIVGLEARLVAIHVAMGAVLGAIAVTLLPARARSSARSCFVAGGLAVLSAELLAGASTMARYPQLYSDTWWRVGGWRAVAQRMVTHSLGPGPFDAILLALAVLAGIRAVTLAWSWRRARWIRVATAVLLAAVVTSLYIGGTRRSGEPHTGAPDVLILAIDSLRADRVPAPEVMPFVSRRAGSGTLFRAAFTPVAHTFPSWVSTLTGTEPRHHGVRSMFPRGESVAHVGPTLFSELRDQGYRTFVTANFAGDVFKRFDAGFEALDSPQLTVDTLATSAALAAHGFTWPLLRWPLVRAALPEWRNMPHLDDPEWLVESTLEQVRRAKRRGSAGLVFFGTAHFPYVAPYPYYRRGAATYRGRFLYDVPPSLGESIDEADRLQARARYDAALSAIDRAIERLFVGLEREGRLANTLVVITGDHGEELYEQDGLAGHGDALAPHAQSVPILLLGPGIPQGRVSRDQVRLYDLPATLLPLIDHTRRGVFGDGVSLFDHEDSRPICVETAMWFWPELPGALRGDRLTYEPVSGLLEVEAGSRAMVVRADRVSAIEDAKDRGIILGDRLWHQRSTPRGIRQETRHLPDVEPAHGDVDLPRLFRERCVDGDPELGSVLGAVLYSPKAEARGPASEKECAACALGR